MLIEEARAIAWPRMLKGQINWPACGLAAAAFLTGALLFWISLHCAGADWYISQIHAEIIYTGLRRFCEFPYFSFVFNGGSYFIQDPQSNLFSPVVPLILLAGPSLGLRLAEGLWGVVGVYAFVVWIRGHRVSVEAALIGGVASATALGVLWRIAIGNDMFLWHLGLPLLLWSADRVLRERTLHSSLWFALMLGLLLLGPTFHSFTYLFVPVVPLYVLLELLFLRPNFVQLRKIFGLFALGCLLSVLMIGFKLAAWLTFPMQRVTMDYGVLPWWSSLNQLFDYSIVDRVRVVCAKYWGMPGHRGTLGWKVEESATALPPIGTLFALVGVFAAAFSKPKRRIGLFALMILLLGLMLTSWSPAWEAFRRMNGGNFRVAQRCLGMSAFGLSVFAALGADLVFARLKRAAWPISLATVVLMLGSAVWWTHASSQSKSDLVNAPIQPIETFIEERETAGKVHSFDTLRRYREQRDILAGTGYTDGFFVVGNEHKPKLWTARSTLPLLFNGKSPANVGGVTQDQISAEHLRIKIRALPPHSRTFLRVLEPRFGLDVTTEPPNAGVIVQPSENLLLVENPTDKPIARVVLRARLPISVLWLIASGLALFGTIAGLCGFAYVRRRGSHLSH